MTAILPDHREAPLAEPTTTPPVHLRNLVPAELILTWADRHVHIPPLGRTRLDAATLASIDPVRLADCNLVRRDDPVHGDDSTRRIGPWIRDKAAVLLVLCVGFAAPAAALLFATPLFQQLMSPDSQRLVPPLSTTITLRALQVLFLGVAITFPALLFFLFDRQRGDLLRKRFEFHMFRLDPRVKTLADVEAYYDLQMDAAFGMRGSTRSQRRPQVSHLAPILIATIVLAVGWIVTSINLQALSSDANVTTVLADLFRPDSSVLAFGFLGAYYFAVNIVLRSYLRGDLHPKTYSQITTRVLEVVVVTALLAVTDVVPHEIALGVAFFAGFVPEIVLQRVWEVVRGALRAGSSNPLAENQPITELDGIDLYERSRLAGEGVENVEALAHGNMIDLLLQTRIPVGRLVDWVDQAILYVHVTAGQSGKPSEQRKPVDALRLANVRTATDLLRAAGDERGRRRLVAEAGPTLTTRRLELLVDSIKAEPWIRNIERWRQDPKREPRIYFLDAQQAS